MPLRNRLLSVLVVTLSADFSLALPALAAAELLPVETDLRALSDPGSILFTVGFLVLFVVPVFYFSARSSRLPVKISVKPLADRTQSAPDVSEYVQKTTEELKALGFSQQLDFSMPELPRRMFFRCLSLSDGAHGVFIQDTVFREKVFGLDLHIQTIQHLEFLTTLDNDVEILTSNALHSDPLLAPTHAFGRRRPNLIGSGDLFDEHRTYVEEVREREVSSLKLQKPEDFVGKYRDLLERTLAYQVPAGLLKRDATGGQYVGTLRLTLRGVLSGFTEGYGGAVGLVIPAVVAFVMTVMTWTIPAIIDLAGMQPTLWSVRLMDTCVIGILGFTVGLASRGCGGWGGFWSGLCYLPSVILFDTSGVPFLMVYAMGGLGEKLASCRNWRRWRDSGLLWPDILMASGSLVLAVFPVILAAVVP